MGEREGEKLGCLEMALIFQAGSSLHDALGVRQAVVVCAPCETLPCATWQLGSQQLNKTATQVRDGPKAGQAGRAEKA